MAPADPPSAATSSRDLQLQELIFSCSICQAIVNDIYASREHNKGFHSGSGDDDGVVTRLWLAECAHAFCGKHLSGGGMWPASVQSLGLDTDRGTKLRRSIPKVNSQLLRALSA